MKLEISISTKKYLFEHILNHVLHCWKIHSLPQADFRVALSHFKILFSIFTFQNSLFKIHFSKITFQNLLFKISFIWNSHIWNPFFEIYLLKFTKYTLQNWHLQNHFLKFTFWNSFFKIHFLKLTTWNSLFEIHFLKFTFWN